MRRCGWVIVAAVAVALAGCSSAVVDGHPESARSSAPTGRPSSSGPASSTQAYLSDPAGVRRIEAQARTDVVASDSYSYQTLAADLSRGLAHTTGEFRAQYRKTFATVVEPAARRLEASQSIQVNAIGMGAMPSPTRAQLLLELQTRTTQESGTPRVDPATAVVTVDLVDGRWLVAALSDGGGGGALDEIGGAGLVAAGKAAETGVADITTLRRAQFAADYARALAATTGSLHRELLSRRSSTRTTLERGRFDLRTDVTGIAVLKARGSSAKMLVTSDSYKSSAPTTPVPSTLEVGVLLVGTRWLVSTVQNVGVS